MLFFFFFFTSSNSNSIRGELQSCRYFNGAFTLRQNCQKQVLSDKRTQMGLSRKRLFWLVDSKKRGSFSKQTHTHQYRSDHAKPSDGYFLLPPPALLSRSLLNSTLFINPSMCVYVDVPSTTQFQSNGRFRVYLNDTEKLSNVLEKVTSTFLNFQIGDA